MLNVTFQELCKNYPSRQPAIVENPCKNAHGLPNFLNQSAARMSVALAASGVNMHHYHKKRCHKKGHDVHAVDARELAEWLSLPAQLGPPKRFADLLPDNYRQISGKRGIIYHISSFDAPDSETAAAISNLIHPPKCFGDSSHKIDLWNICGFDKWGLINAQPLVCFHYVEFWELKF